MAFAVKGSERLSQRSRFSNKISQDAADISEEVEQPDLVATMIAQQKVHETRVERLLERHLELVTQRHLELVTQMLSGSGGKVASGVPETPQRSPASSSAAAVNAEQQAALLVARRSGPGRSGDAADARALEPKRLPSATSIDAEPQTAPQAAPQVARGFSSSGSEASPPTGSAGGAQVPQVAPQVARGLSSTGSEASASPASPPRSTRREAPRTSTATARSQISWPETAGMTMSQLEKSCKALTKAALQDTEAKQVAQKLTQHRAFECFFQALIVANAVILGVEQDWQARHIGQVPPPAYFYVDLAFGCLFLVELIMRILASGPNFFSCWNKEVRWNVFDTLLVSSAVVEMILTFAADSIAFSVSTGRLLRLLRLVRVFRIVRVFRFFKDLRVMVLSVMACFRPLLVALLLLFVLIYVFAVCLLQFVNEDLAYQSLQPGGRETIQFRDLRETYGSLWRASYTLFLSISGGVSWGEVCDPLFAISGWLALLFLIYITFCVFCVLNIITGIFVEEAAAMAAEDQENMMFSEMQRRQRFVDEVKGFFCEADKDGSGQLSWEEFSERLQHVQAQKLMENLGIDIVGCGAWNVFQTFDSDGNGNIEIEEFTSALTQMRGTARSIDLASLRQEHRKVKRDVATILRCVTERRDHI